MLDPEVRFAAELGRSIGRWDWWALKGEHTQFQWRVQRILEHVHPLGERRSDLRGAHLTANLIAMHASETMPDDEFKALVTGLANYLKDVAEYQEEQDLKAVKILEGETWAVNS